jgi:RNA polymerase sigma-70 factor (ECF subfamily)
VPAATLEDALQDVYVVVLRRLDGFHEGTHARAWLFAIAMRVAANYRRSLQRRGPLVALRESEPDKGSDSFESAARAHAARIVHAFIDRLDDDRRAVFVMAELEQMTAPEIAMALSANVNTVYSRLRTARGEFEAMLAQLHGRAGGDHD